jgi:hypothetical protein
VRRQLFLSEGEGTATPRAAAQALIDVEAEPAGLSSALSGAAHSQQQQLGAANGAGGAGREQPAGAQADQQGTADLIDFNDANASNSKPSPVKTGK